MSLTGPVLSCLIPSVFCLLCSASLANGPWSAGPGTPWSPPIACPRHSLLHNYSLVAVASHTYNSGATSRRLTFLRVYPINISGALHVGHQVSFINHRNRMAAWTSNLTSSAYSHRNLTIRFNAGILKVGPIPPRDRAGSGDVMECAQQRL